MKRRVHLTLDAEIAAQASAYARTQGESLSDLVNNLLATLTRVRRRPVGEARAPAVRRLVGAAAGSRLLDPKEAYREHLRRKYLDETSSSDSEGGSS